MTETSNSNEMFRSEQVNSSGMAYYCHSSHVSMTPFPIPHHRPPLLFVFQVIAPWEKIGRVVATVVAAVVVVLVNLVTVR